MRVCYDEDVADFQLFEGQGCEEIVPEWFVELLLNVNKG